MWRPAKHPEQHGMIVCLSCCVLSSLKLLFGVMLIKNSTSFGFTLQVLVLERIPMSKGFKSTNSR